MNDSEVSLELEGLEDLDGKTADQAKCDTLKIIILYKLIQIDAEAFKRYQ